MATFRRTLGGYFDALVAVALAIVLKKLIDPWPGTSFDLFHAAIAVSAWFGGLGPGIFATVISGILAESVFLPAQGRPLEDELRLFLFVFESSVVALLLAELRTSREAATRSKRDVADKNRALETSLVALQREMRERQEAESALSTLRARHEQQSRWLDMILRWSQEPIALFDREGRYLLASDSVIERTGRRREELLGKDLDLLGLPDALREAFRARLDEVVARREPVTDEGIWPSAAGPRHVEYVLSPMLGAGGRVESVLTTVRDVTERRQREALLREREEFFRLVFERGPLAVCIISTDGRILRVNARLCEMLGHSADELAARAFDDLGHPEDRELERPLQGRLEAGELDHYDLEKRLLTRQGVPIWVRQSRSAVKDEAGELLYGLVMLEDIDARRRAEAERRALELQLRETQKLESLGVLAGGIAHDFNNLLVPVLGNAELLIEDLPDDSRLQAYAKDIVSAAERAAQLARQMLAYSGKGRFVLESTSLGTLVSSMRDLLRAQVGTACTLDFDLDLELPPIEGDLSQLRQVVLNLVQNAAEALPDGNGTITVRVAPRHATRALLAGTHLSTELAEGDYVCLEVTDTGVGMDDATRERVFDPFFTSKGPGRGLGLPAVLGSIRGHGGAIRVDSRPGRGTTVTVLFPPLAAPSARPAERAASGAAAEAVAGTILLVEDEDAVRLTAQRALERMGLVVMSARDGEEALELFERHGEDLACALVDVMMPRVSGDEVCRRMRARLAGLPILVMSGYHAGAITDRLAGVVDAVVQKPFTPAGLQEAVRRALSRAPESAPRT